MIEQVKDINEVVVSLIQKLTTLEKTIAEQAEEILRLNKVINLLQKDLYTAKLTIAEQDKEIADLKERLAKYEKPELK